MRVVAGMRAATARRVHRGCLALGLVLVPSLALAEPGAALRAGVQALELARDDGIDVQATGPMIEGELAWRMRTWSVAAFATYATAHIAYDVGTGSSSNGYSLDEHVLDAGARVRALLGESAFAGAGLALERLVERGSDEYVHGLPPFQPTSMPVDRSGAGLAIEVHVGYAFPHVRACACTLEVLAAASHAFTGEALSTTSGRLALGVAFW